MVRLSVPSARDARQSCSSSRSSATSSPATSLPEAPAPSCSMARRPTICWFVVGAIYHEACLCWHSCNAASASATTICSSVCLGNFLMVIHSARPQAARTTQNNPLKTNGPKNPDPSSLLVAVHATRVSPAPRAPRCVRSLPALPTPGGLPRGSRTRPP